MRGWRRRVLCGGTGLLAGGVAGVLVLLLVTPSADSAAERSRQLTAAHPQWPALTVLPARVSEAVLAVEDHRFRRHPGIDPLALARAGRGALCGRDEGGSTIEVQLAKLLYTGGRHGLRDQAEQAALALKLDRAYSKDQILLMYLNDEYFGHGFYGVDAAAQGYFHAAPQELTWAQAALLAGLLKAPDSDDPLRHPDRALRRRRHVLQRLHAIGAITASQATEADRGGLQLAGAPSSVH